MVRVLYTLCFVSGFAALVFEHVFFRKAGLLFGNSVWASSLVLAAFMAGLAAGSLIAAAASDRLRRPLRAYALLEAVVATSGALVVVVTPHLSVLGPWLGQFLERPLLVNVLRLLAAFLLMCLPTTAMGATLPFLVKAAERLDPRFGVVLGRLYGWNTLGAMTGAMAGELLLYRTVGVRGAGLAAAGCDLVIAGTAFVLADRLGGRQPAAEPAAAPEPGVVRPPVHLLAVAALSGAVLLALEVVWARFFLLFTAGTTYMFAVLLAVVLAGIGLGGLLAGRLQARWPRAHEWLPVAALAAGFLVAGGYAWFRSVPALAARLGGSWRGVTLLMALALAFPVSALSGVLFTLTGAAMRDRLAASGRAAGLLTVANTAGAMVGALVAGFLLLPRVGMERSFFAAALTYGLIAVLAGGRGWRRPAAVGAAALWLCGVALFPFGLMERAYMAWPLHAAPGQTWRLAAAREGLTETIFYVEGMFENEPIEQRLVTNSHTMSATALASRRYMKLYTYLPVALHPGMRKALLISYGVGATAKSLTDTRELEHIDVVDISRDVLELSSVVYPDPAQHPLRDPRVRSHVEDGRYFLQATAERYDLITAEPPPPKLAGITNLYSLEFFRLVRQRLAPGFASYWLPLFELDPRDAQAITAAFCGAFPDCTLWKGMALSWMLVGTRDGAGPVAEDRFTRQWRDPVAGVELRNLGFEVPEQLGALFVADAPELAAFVGSTPPLDDDHPQRLGPIAPITPPRWWVPLGDSEQARQRFAKSAWVSRFWPERMRTGSLPFFAWQACYDRTLEWDRRNSVADLDQALRGSDLAQLPLMLMQSDADRQAIARRARARGSDSPLVWAEEAKAALAHRDFDEAARLFGQAARRGSTTSSVAALHAYAAARAGRSAEAQAVLAARPDIPPESRAFIEGLVGPPTPTSR